MNAPIKFSTFHEALGELAHRTAKSREVYKRYALWLGVDPSLRGYQLDAIEYYLDAFTPTCTHHKHRNRITAWLCGKYMTLLYSSFKERAMYRAIKEARANCDYSGPNP